MNAQPRIATAGAPCPAPPPAVGPGKGLASLGLCFSICSGSLHSLISESAFRPEETDLPHPPSIRLALVSPLYPFS